jgi:ribosome-binding protein aMBF1 (putative translation factor)
MQDNGMQIADLVEATGLDGRVVELIVTGNYTPSPKQRDRVANALGIERDAVQWGHSVAVDNMYGHGPQFGRSP